MILKKGSKIKRYEIIFQIIIVPLIYNITVNTIN